MVKIDFLEKWVIKFCIIQKFPVENRSVNKLIEFDFYFNKLDSLKGNVF